MEESTSPHSKHIIGSTAGLHCRPARAAGSDAGRARRIALPSNRCSSVSRWLCG